MRRLEFTPPPDGNAGLMLMLWRAVHNAPSPQQLKEAELVDRLLPKIREPVRLFTDVLATSDGAPRELQKIEFVPDEPYELFLEEDEYEWALKAVEVALRSTPISEVPVMLETHRFLQAAPTYDPTKETSDASVGDD